MNSAYNLIYQDMECLVKLSSSLPYGFPAHVMPIMFWVLFQTDDTPV